VAIESLKRFREEANGTQVLVLAGSAKSPQGEFTNSMQLLESGIFDQTGITRIGVAGHPEGCPDISTSALRTELIWKNEFQKQTDAQMYILTQFCFASGPIIQWENQLAAMNNTLPIHIGIPGVATIGTLIRHAASCGIGPSMDFLKKQAKSASKLLRHSTPDRLLWELADYRLQHPNTLIEKVHIYPFGGLRKSTEWLERFGLPGSSVIETQSVA